MCNGKLTLSYGPGKLKLGYGLPDHGKINLGYGSRGKLNLSYGRQPQTEQTVQLPEHGKLNLGYGSRGKLNLSYGRQLQLPEHGKLNLAYGSRGKLNLSYGSQPQTATPPPKAGKLNLGYDGKLQLAYQPPQAVKGKLHLGYAAPGKLQLGYSAKEGSTESCASKALPVKSQPAVSNAPAKTRPQFQYGVSNVPCATPPAGPAKTPPAVINAMQDEIPIDMSKLAFSGDGSVENVGVKLDAPLQCNECRQRFVTKQALDIHWRFIHDPSRHQED